MTDLPPRAIRMSMMLNPRVYISVYPIPEIRETGNIVARRRLYVGEQVEKTGQSAAQVKMDRRSGFVTSCTESSV
jgi:hypothetical protein